MVHHLHDQNIVRLLSSLLPTYAHIPYFSIVQMFFLSGFNILHRRWFSIYDYWNTFASV